MTQEDITNLSRESGLWLYGLGKDETNFNYLVAKFAYLVAAAEREACAQVASQGTGEAVQTRTLEILQSERNRIAKAIRARGEK